MTIGDADALFEAASDNGEHPQERGGLRQEVRKPGQLCGRRQHHRLREGGVLDARPGRPLSPPGKAPAPGVPRPGPLNLFIRGERS